MNYPHKTLAQGRWAQMSLAEQLGNIGSEIFRANKWKQKGNMEQCKKAMYRALELISLTTDAQRGKHCLKEFIQFYEVVCDYYLGENEYNSTGQWLQKYYDDFIKARH